MKPTKSIKIKFLNKIIGAFIALVGVTSLANAATLTVDNKTNAVAMYSSLQDAITAASSGDVILVAGSATSYGGIIIDKQLTLIGAGYKSDTQIGLGTTLSSIAFHDGSANSSVSGFVTGSITGGKNASGIVVERCQITKYSTGSSGQTDNEMTFRNCVFISPQYTGSTITASFYTPSQITLQNCVFSVSSWYSDHVLNSTLATSNVIFDHCLFIGGKFTQDQCEGVIVSNSIFINSRANGATNSSFSNNITDGTQIFVANTNTGGNNLNETDPLFSNESNNVFEYTDDYRLQTGSPAIGAASDGTDIGIYGGSYPFPEGGEGEYLMAASPKIPQIYEMNIENASVPVSGTLSVQVKAKKID